MKITRFAAAASVAALLALGVAAYAGQQYPAADDNSSIGSVIMQWLNGSSKGVPVSASNPLPVSGNGAPNITPTDCSGSITTGGTAQNAIAAQAALHGFVIKNIDASAGSGEPLWISFTGTAAAATTGSYPLGAPAVTSFANGESFTTPMGFGVNHAISIVAATTGHKFSCTWW
jgi:hypothetical protein